MITDNLNDLFIETDDYEYRHTGDSQEDYTTESEDRQTQVYFKDLYRHLIRHIQQADIVVGCVAWLTHPDILDALAEKEGVALIVQKEDFLRPDKNSTRGWKADLHRRYAALPSTLTRQDSALAETRLWDMSYCDDPTIPAVRCVGIHNADKAPAIPRAHHKFVVFCRSVPLNPTEEWEEDKTYVPYAVWTGSFNFTVNSMSSFENAVVLSDPKIVRAYFCEFGQVAALSEPLNWQDQWVAPEWRIGT